MNFTSTTPFYIAQGQDQRGPYPRHEVEQMLATGALMPSDLCWSEGMSGWQPLQSVLPPKTTPPPSVEDTYNPYTPPKVTPEETWSKPVTQSYYGGIGRLSYFGFNIGLGIAQAMVAGGLGADSGASAIILLLTVIFSIIIIAQRLKNVGMSQWFCLLAFVPLANLFIGYRCIACPEGFADTRTLDTAGKIITWGLVLLLILFVGLLFFASNIN